MLHKKLVWKFIITLFAIFILFSFSLNFPKESISAVKLSHPTSIMLEYPPFLKVAHAADECQLNQSDIESIENEAGIAAYAKLTDPIAIADIEHLMIKTPKKKTDSVLSGLMFIPDYKLNPGEHSEALVYIHSCGWIIAYLPKGKPVAELVDWKNYEENRLSQTTLERIIQDIISEAKAEPTLTGFFHFAYPDATDIVFAVEGVNFAYQTEEFQVTVPNDFTILESSVSTARYGIVSWYRESTCALNDEIITRLLQLKK